MQETRVRVAIIGAGFSGLGAAVRLHKAGITDFLVLERGADVGGTWRDNTYPGCRCDVPSHLYSFSFALNPHWTRSFSAQPEIQEYLRRCADDFGVRGRIRFGTEVRAAQWRGAWHLQTSTGPIVADALIAAAGPLCEPVYPDLPGLNRFAGTAFHSARWDHGHDLHDARVAVIGTGASAVQFVPEIQPVVRRLHVFQRTAPWIVPRLDGPIPQWRRRLFRRAPVVQRLARWRDYVSRELLVPTYRHPRLAERINQQVGLAHLRRQVPDPALRARLTPDYTMGCKRVLLSNDYLPSLTKPNVEVVTDGIAEVTESGIVGRDGVERPVDTIIFGTGFRVSDMPIARAVVGADGRTLAETWQGSPEAYAGTTVAGFPNLFLLLGPNTGLGHTSVVLMVEAQLRHVLEVLRLGERRGGAALAPTPAAQRAWISYVDDAAAGTVWTSGGCASWYLDGTGRNFSLWPRSVTAFKLRMARFRPDDYATVSRTTPAEVTA